MKTYTVKEVTKIIYGDTDKNSVRKLRKLLAEGIIPYRQFKKGYEIRIRETDIPTFKRNQLEPIGKITGIIN